MGGENKRERIMAVENGGCEMFTVDRFFVRKIGSSGKSVAGFSDAANDGGFRVMLAVIFGIIAVFAGCGVVLVVMLARFAHQNHLRMRLRDGRVMVDCESKPETGGES